MKKEEPKQVEEILTEAPTTNPEEKETTGITEGIYKMVSLALLEQSMVLTTGYIGKEAQNTGNAAYNTKLKEYEKKGFKNTKQRASKDAVKAENAVLKTMKYLTEKSVDHISKSLSYVQEDAKKDYDKYSEAVGKVAVEMIKMDDPRRAHLLLKMYNAKMLDRLFEELEKPEEKTKVDDTGL
jgi:hypothetical protein